MILGKVVGTATSTVKCDVYEGKKVLFVQPITPEGKPMGRSFLSVDAVQAGVGDIVLAAREGNTARQILGTAQDPFHSVILAVVDHVVIGSPGSGGETPVEAEGGEHAS